MAESPTIAQALAQLHTQGLERLDAQLLMLHVLGLPAQQRSWLLTHDTEVLDPDAQIQLTELAHRRLQGAPLPYLSGHQGFYGLDLTVGPGVLVPRPDTETLVDWALAVLPSTPARVLDLGTGSGAIALAIQSHRPLAQVWAVDRSEEALDYARRNAEALSLPLHLLRGSWFEALPPDAAPFDCIVSNPPYVAEGDPHLAALHAEPISALTSGADGLDDVRAIVAQAQVHLKPGGWLLIEHGYDQAATVRGLLTQAGYLNAQSRTDLNRIERCSGGQRA
jgi:release factor glutamine methyltransferase